LRGKAGGTGGKIQVVKKRKGGVTLPWQVLFNGLGKLFRVVRLWCFGVASAGSGISHNITLCDFPSTK